MPSPRRPGGRCIIRRLMLLVLMLALRKEGGGSDDRVDADEDEDEDGGGGSGGTEEATEVPNTTVGARLWLVPDGAIGTIVASVAGRKQHGYMDECVVQGDVRIKLVHVVCTNVWSISNVKFIMSLCISNSNQP